MPKRTFIERFAHVVRQTYMCRKLEHRVNVKRFINWPVSHSCHRERC